ncbi:MAG: transporter [Betaproteobacteria bacterium HGW-Betaproteobacteria-13]|jgi:osmotically-inducible protein OsmY|uniref:Transporter n=1 Tax=Parazoarcus communis TaxID=41977 RepID=A0A2U8H230_9RHOO|nr:BON domain-containing protein [Parazoarcus communis]AWI79680.1 transporter [Parazoarcus communis]PKO79272.1 MAG: transporter [Betaproteobacteria bacterium HGW-Betaproteobacteria-13]
MNPSRTRRKLLLGLCAAGTLPLLQGCFPVVATGVGAGAMMIADRRSSGVYVEDEGIEWKAASRLREQFGTINHINVTSYNRNVLLTGEVQNETVRAEAERIIAGVENVRGIINELAIGPASSMSARANDSLITSNVKARFVDGQSFSANHVKVVTEANVVFLMGLVKRSEADAASAIASTSQGVRKVVRVFDYISDDEARRLDAPAGSKQKPQ